MHYFVASKECLLCLHAVYTHIKGDLQNPQAVWGEGRGCYVLGMHQVS